MKGPTAWFTRLPIPNLDRPCTFRVADIHHLRMRVKPVAVVSGAYSGYAHLPYVCSYSYYLLAMVHVTPTWAIGV